MRAEPLLTIAVPTYNRAGHLQLLLSTLQSELVGHHDEVSVLVLDNASEDDTPIILADFASKLPNMRVVRNPTNIGGDANVCACASIAESKYLWIMGDDDCPRTGVIPQVVDMLRLQIPDMIFLRSGAPAKIKDPAGGVKIRPLKYRFLSRTLFSRRVNVWFTFISGIVINRQRLLATAGESVIRKYRGTGFPQLGWVLNTLKFGDRFIFISEYCVVATPSNTDGYGVLRVFGINYSTIVSDVFGRDTSMSRTLIGRNLLCYLPGLIWHSRFSNTGKFLEEDIWQCLRRELSGFASYWIFLLPVARLPNKLAWPFFQAWRVVAKFVNLYDRMTS